MSKMTFFLLLSFNFSCGATSSYLSDGLYYSYWVYGSQESPKEYPILANKPKKINGKYILSDYDANDSSNEIYVKILNGIPSFFYTQASSEGDVITQGWANAYFSKNNLIISTSTVVMNPKGSKKLYNERITIVGDRFTGKKIPLEKKEKVPIEKIDSNSFKVNCNKYLDINNYRNGYIPDYSEALSNDQSVRRSYGGTIFINGDGLCALLLDDETVPQIKNGWILFKKLE